MNTEKRYTLLCEYYSYERYVHFDTFKEIMKFIDDEGDRLLDYEIWDNNNR